MTTSENLDRIEIVLSRPQYSGNIGSVCRAMKTMGLTHLAVVPSAEYDETQIKTYSIHAYDIWQNRRIFNTLEDALGGSVLSVASTRRRGKSRKLTYFTPEEVAERVSHFGYGKISVVFGCESDGLSDAEVRLCNEVLTIPTSPLFPSLNLAQAVQIVCYALFTGLKEYPAGGFAVDRGRSACAAEKCSNALETIGYFKIPEEKEFTTEFIRDIISRASLTEGETQRFEKLFVKTERLSTHRKSE